MRHVFKIDQEQEFMACIAENAGCHHQRLCNPPSLVVLTGGDIPPEPVPEVVTPRQIRLALNQIGLRATVEQAVAAGSQDLKDWWEYALDIERNNALVVGMAQPLGITAQQLDDLFRLAATL